MNTTKKFQFTSVGLRAKMEISEAEISKPSQVILKLSSWLDNAAVFALSVKITLPKVKAHVFRFYQY